MSNLSEIKSLFDQKTRESATKCYKKLNIFLSEIPKRRNITQFYQIFQQMIESIYNLNKRQYTYIALSPYESLHFLKSNSVFFNKLFHESLYPPAILLSLNQLPSPTLELLKVNKKISSIYQTKKIIKNEYIEFNIFQYYLIKFTLYYWQDDLITRNSNQLSTMLILLENYLNYFLYHDDITYILDNNQRNSTSTTTSNISRNISNDFLNILIEFWFNQNKKIIRLPLIYTDYQRPTYSLLLAIQLLINHLLTDPLIQKQKSIINQANYHKKEKLCSINHTSLSLLYISLYHFIRSGILQWSNWSYNFSHIIQILIYYLQPWNASYNMLYLKNYIKYHNITDKNSTNSSLKSFGQQIFKNKAANGFNSLISSTNVNRSNNYNNNNSINTSNVIHKNIKKEKKL